MPVSCHFRNCKAHVFVVEQRYIKYLKFTFTVTTDYSFAWVLWRERVERQWGISVVLLRKTRCCCVHGSRWRSLVSLGMCVVLCRFNGRQFR